MKNSNFPDLEIFFATFPLIYFSVYWLCKNDLIDDDNCSRQPSKSWPSLKACSIPLCWLSVPTIESLGNQWKIRHVLLFRKRSFKLISTQFHGYSIMSKNDNDTLFYDESNFLCPAQGQQLFFFNFWCCSALCVKAPWRLVASRCSKSCLTQNFFH